MPKIIAQNVAQQAKQIAEETFEGIRSAPKQMAGAALEQLGMSGGKPQQKSPAPSTGQPDVEKIKLEELKKQKEKRAHQQIGQIEQEIRHWVEIRKKTMEEWRRAQEEKMAAQKKQEEAQNPLLEVKSRPKRGLWSGFQRIKTAQKQSQPETAGRRIGG